MNFHDLITKLGCFYIWGTPKSSAKKFHEFALAEQASMLDISAAAHLTQSDVRRALYVNHLLDEKRHALMFTLRSSDVCMDAGITPYENPHADIENLFESLGEEGFLAFVHLGEKRACEQFTVYRNWFRKRGDKVNKSLFEAIIKDELRHADYTWKLLVEMAGSESAARRKIRNARLWEAWRNWLRMGRSIADTVFNLLSLIIYLLITPYALLTKIVKRRGKGWTVPALEREIETSEHKIPAKRVSLSSERLDSAPAE